MEHGVVIKTITGVTPAGRTITLMPGDILKIRGHVADEESILVWVEIVGGSYDEVRLAVWTTIGDDGCFWEAPAKYANAVCLSEIVDSFDPTNDGKRPRFGRYLRR